MTDSSYSGSDRTGVVERNLAAFSSVERTGRQEEIAALQDALTIERDRNWRGLIHTWIGTWRDTFDQQNESRTSLETALASFDFLSPNFADVVNDYVWCIWLLTTRYWDAEIDEERRSILRYGTSALALASQDAPLDSYERFRLIQALARAFLNLVDPPDCFPHWARDLGVTLGETGYFLMKGDPESWEELAHRTYLAYDLNRSEQLIHQALAEIPQDSESRPRLISLLQEVQQLIGQRDDN